MRLGDVTCDCGGCRKCRNRAAMRRHRLTLEERKRDMERAEADYGRYRLDVRAGALRSTLGAAPGSFALAGARR